MVEKVEEKLKIWLGQFPQSTHPLDSQRLYDLVISLCDNNSSIDDEDIRNVLRTSQPKWDEEFVNQFIHNKLLLISELQAFLNYYRERYN